MEPGVILKKIQFIDGKELPLKAGSITVITGPNNSGKSTSLRDLDRHFSGSRGRSGYSGRIISEVETQIVGAAKDFFEYFRSLGLYKEEEDRYRFSGRYSNNGYKSSTIRNGIQKNNLPNPAEAVFRKFLPASERLSSTGYKDSVDYAIDKMFSNEPLEIELSEIFRRSFGTDLILDRTRKEGVFHLADRKDLVDHDQRLKPEFRQWMQKQPTLRNQGDGMRGFARILIEILVRRLSIIAIDEPELFLHPPQIRQLAGLIVSQKPQHAQVFIATHSDEFIKGILDSRPKDLNFIRLTRNERKSVVNYLRHSDVDQLWSDPLLRTSNALSALFHQFTIVCEGETDARFLRWAMDEEMQDDLSIDYFVTSGGSKQKIHSIVNAIASIGANVISVADIDVLNDRLTFQRLFEAHGAEYAEIEVAHKLILERVAQRRTEVTGHYLWSEISKLKTVYGEHQNVPPDLAAELSSLIRRSSPWGRIKEDGQRAFIDSDSINAFKEISEAAEKVGIFVNPEGELESLCRSISRANKSAWLANVIEQDYRASPKLDLARHFIKRISKYLKENKNSLV